MQTENQLQVKANCRQKSIAGKSQLQAKVNCRQKSIAGKSQLQTKKPVVGRKPIGGGNVSKNTLFENRFIYILMDVGFIRTKTRVRGPIIHISGQNSPYDMKTEVLTHVNVQ